MPFSISRRGVRRAPPRPLLLAAGAALLLAAAPANAEVFAWSNLPDLPEPLGVAGPFVFVIDDKLVVAGGAHFAVSPFQGGAKRWVAASWVLDSPAGEWRASTPLPRPLAYGGSVSLGDSALLLGGSDAERHYADAYRVRFADGELIYEPAAPLPAPAANMAAAELNGVIYVAGGQAAPDSVTARRTLWTLDGNAENPRWQAGEPFPGPARILAPLVAQDGAVFLFSGAELLPGEAGAPTRRFLTDSFRYDPGKGWRRLADAPRSVTAAPAAPLGPSHIAIFGGDDGANFLRNDELGDNHPGFPRNILGYHTVTDTWTDFGEAPVGHVTTAAVAWRGRTVIASGEDRPGHRSPAVPAAAPITTTSGFASIDYIALTVYLAGLVLMGVYFSRKHLTSDDFFLAGGRMAWWAAGLSIYGTQLSSISFMAIPAKIYSTDWVYFLMQMTIVMIAFPVVFFYLPFFRRVKMTSAYEYLEQRFNLPVRLYASVSFILYQIGRMAIVLFLPAIALSTVTGFDVYACILLMGVLATTYTVLGGIEAVIWTDVVQVFVLLGGALLSLAILAFNVEGGIGGIVSAGMEYDKFHVFNWTWDRTTTAVWVVVVGNLFNNLVPYTSDQAVVQRYFTTRDEKTAAKSIWTNAVMLIPSTLTLFMVGTGLWAFYRAHPELLNPTLPTDSVFPLFIAQQLPAGIAGIVIAAVFAASMSTLDSSLNSVSAAMVTDFYVRFRESASDKQRLRLARRLTAVLGVLATGTSIALASFEVGSLWDTFQGMMGLFGGGLAGLFALGIFFKGASGRGALIGAVSSVVILYWTQQHSDLHFFLYGAVGVLSCVGVGLAASVFVKDRADKDLTGLTIGTMRRS